MTSPLGENTPIKNLPAETVTTGEAASPTGAGATEPSGTTEVSADAPNFPEKLPTNQLVRYLAGFFLCGLMWVIPWAASIQILLPQRFVDLNLPNPTVMVSTVNAIGAIVALLSNIIFGALSDHTRSRMGRRSPYIIFGSLFAGICLYLTFVATSQALIITGWIGMQIGLNALLAPFLATIADRIPDLNRGAISTAYGLSFVLGASLGNYVGSVFLKNVFLGGIVASSCLGIIGLLVFLIFPKEASSANLAHQKMDVKQLLLAFSPPRKKGSSDLYKALFGEMSINCGYFMVYSFLLYLFTQYLKLDTNAAQVAIQAMIVPTLITSVIGAGLAGPVSDKLGKRKPVVIVSAVIMGASFIVPWIWPTPTAMIIWAVIAGLGYGIYSAMTQALNVAVLPDKNDAGKDLGFLNMASTVGQVVGSVVTGTIVSLTGSYALVFPVAIVFMGLATVLIGIIKKDK